MFSESDGWGERGCYELMWVNSTSPCLRTSDGNCFNYILFNFHTPRQCLSSGRQNRTRMWTIRLNVKGVYSTRTNWITKWILQFSTFPTFVIFQVYTCTCTPLSLQNINKLTIIMGLLKWNEIRYEKNLMNKSVYINIGTICDEVEI